MGPVPHIQAFEPPQNIQGDELLRRTASKERFEQRLASGVKMDNLAVQDRILNSDQLGDYGGQSTSDGLRRHWLGAILVPESMSVPEPLLASVYDELRRLAAYHLSSERRGHTLQATALVHEAYMRLAGQSGGQWHDRLHFIRVASEMMRRVLVDHARSHLRNKRGGGVTHVSLSEAMEIVDGHEVEVLDLDRALNRLAEVDPRKARLVELRYFGGLTMEECAEVLGASSATLERDWRFSRAFLRREIGSTGSA